jgi:hypothetical protein
VTGAPPCSRSSLLLPQLLPRLFPCPGPANLLQGLGVPLDLPTAAPATQANPFRRNAAARAPPVPVAPAAPVHGAFGDCGFDAEAYAAALKQEAAKSSANPAPAAGPGSPPASNPKKRENPDEELYVSPEGNIWTAEEFAAKVEESRRSAELVYKVSKCRACWPAC